MAANSFEQRGPATPIVESIRVDKVSPQARLWHNLRALLVIVVAAITLIPVYWIVTTAFKTQSDAVSMPPMFVGFQPSLQGIVSLLTDRSTLSQDDSDKLAQRTDLSLFERVALERGQAVNGPSPFSGQILNSIVIAGVSTVFSVTLGLFSAYAFSRFDIPGSGDLLFFILSTRMLPPIVVTIPIFLMYRAIGLHDTHLGLILLYTVFNLSFSVWLLKGFLDEIPREYEEAALVDGYTRMQAFFRIVIPQAITGIAATTVFCLIFAWNEFAFALMLTTNRARTAPPAILGYLGRGIVEWATIASATLLFLIPVVIVTFALRKHLLRGVTFGAIRK